MNNIYGILLICIGGLQSIIDARQKLESQQQENRSVQKVCKLSWFYLVN